jgi:hypothetical protein
MAGFDAVPDRPRRLPILVLTQMGHICTFSPNALFFYGPLSRWVVRCKPAPGQSVYAAWYPEYDVWGKWNDVLDAC